MTLLFSILILPFSLLEMDIECLSGGKKDNKKAVPDGVTGTSWVKALCCSFLNRWCVKVTLKLLLDVSVFCVS